MKNNSPLIISVTGWSGSGKTTFCEKLIAELAGRGFKTVAAKNSHRSLQTDKPGSDSKRFFDAGAESVCLNADNSMTLFFHRRIESGDELPALFPGADFIIAEGFKAEAALKIEVAGEAASTEEMKNPASEADIIVCANDKLIEMLSETFPTDGKTTKKKHKILIHRNDIITAADFICSVK